MPQAIGALILTAVGATASATVATAIGCVSSPGAAIGASPLSCRLEASR